LKERKARPRPSPQRRKEWEDFLKARLIADASQSVSMIAANLGVRQTCLQYWFPELCQLLSQRHKAAIKIRSKKHQAQQSQRVKEVVKIVRADGRYPSQRQVDYVLNKEGMSLAQPHLLRAYIKALGDL
jgi:transposase-like protein